MRFPLPMPCWCYERIMWRRRARHGKIGVQGFAAQRAASTTPADSESPCSVITRAVSIDRSASDAKSPRALEQDIGLARISQEVTERFAWLVTRAVQLTHIWT